MTSRRRRGGRAAACVTAGTSSRCWRPRPAGRLSVTYTVATPSGGEHRYYAAPAGPELRNTAGRLGWRIDTRAAGGYAVAAGSMRRTAGGLLHYRVTNHAPVAPLPEWISAALTREPPAVEGQPTTHRAGPWQHGRHQAYVRAAVRGEAEAVTRAAPGTRNHTLFRAAANLGELAGAGLLEETDAAEALLAAARRHIGVEGFTLAEAQRTIGNGLTRGRRSPRTVTDPR